MSPWSQDRGPQDHGLGDHGLGDHGILETMVRPWSFNLFFIIVIIKFMYH